MVFNFKSSARRRRQHARRGNCLSDLRVGERAVLQSFSLAPAVAEHLMNLGFLPGLEVLAARSGPGGDPCIYRVDGTEVALRREVSRRITIRPVQLEQAAD